jgi:hypothetical protein
MTVCLFTNLSKAKGTGFTKLNIYLPTFFDIPLFYYLLMQNFSMTYPCGG